MDIPQSAVATGSSLMRDWLDALRYWLRGRNGVITLTVLVVGIGAALNWSWLVAVGIAPLLLTVLPCAAMCGLGLCMNEMAGGSCSTSSSEPDPARMPEPSAANCSFFGAQRDSSGPLAARAAALPDDSITDGGGSAPELRVKTNSRGEGVTCADT